MSYPDSETRVIQLQGEVLRYQLVRRRRRSIGIKVDEAGLTVSAPPRAPYRRLDQVLTENAAWILRKLNEQRARAAPPRRWQSGEALPLLGEVLGLYVYRSHTRGEPQRVARHLLVGVPEPRDAAAVEARVATWYRAEAARHFAARLAALAPRLGVAPPRFKLSNARSSWGVCTASGELRLSWRLIKAPADQIDYVVAHELAHLRHMNHSPAFWQTVASIYPDYQRARKALERDGHLYQTF